MTPEGIKSKIAEIKRLPDGACVKFRTDQLADLIEHGDVSCFTEDKERQAQIKAERPDFLRKFSPRQTVAFDAKKAVVLLESYLPHAQKKVAPKKVET